MSPGFLDSRTNSSPLRSTAKLSVRKVSAGFESFSRNHAEQAFSVCRIARTLSRARRIFCPVFPLVARSSCTRSLRASHPVCAKPVGLHGFADGTLIGGASHVGVSLRSAPSGDEAESPVAAVAAFESTALLESFVHGARPIVRLASGRGSAARRMNFTACGNAAVPEKHNTKGSATARILRRAEYIFVSRPDLTHHRPPPRRASRWPSTGSCPRNGGTSIRD